MVREMATPWAGTRRTVALLAGTAYSVQATVASSRLRPTTLRKGWSKSTSYSLVSGHLSTSRCLLSARKR